MKALTLNELVKVLSTPDAQPMGTLMDACKQAAQFIRSEKVIYEKGAAFAKLFTEKTFETLEAPKEPPEAPTPEEFLTEKYLGPGILRTEGSSAPSKPAPQPAPQMISGQCNIFISGVRPVRGIPPGDSKLRIAQLKALREASGDLNAAPRMTMQKANELLGNLEMGDQFTLIRTIPQMEEATEIIKELAVVGIMAEVRT
jgi:hypothetical protein